MARLIFSGAVSGKGGSLRKVKALHISQAAGGVQRHVIDVVSRIDKSRFEAAGICPPQDLINGVSTDKESFLEAFKKAGVRAYPLVMRREISPISDAAALWRIYSFLKKEKFDVVHTHSSKAGFLGRIAAKMAGVPVIAHTPNNFAFDRPRRMIAQIVFFGILERFAGLFCDRVFAVCGDEKELAVRLGVLPKEKIALISNFIDVSMLNFGADAAKKRIELGIKENERLIVSVGRLAAQKSPRDFVLAAEMALQKRKDARFLFLGDGPLFKETENLIRKKNLTGYVRILGWRNDSAEVTAASDIFALASLWEALPNHSLLDAMALSKPAVITATSGARDMVTDGFNGYVVPVADQAAMAAAILKLLELPGDKLKQMGRRSREIFDKRPSPGEIVRIIEDTYVEILHKKGIC